MKQKKWLVVIVLLVVGLVGIKVGRISTQKGVLSATSEGTVEERLSSLENRVYILEKNAGLIKSRGTGKTSEQFINLIGGSVLASEWTKITGTDFSFDAALYGKLVEVSWQGWIEGSGRVRLYDATNHRAVDYSEFVSTSDSKKSFYSKPMAIWRGQNQYYVEGKSGGGTLILSSSQLKVTVK